MIRLVAMLAAVAMSGRAFVSVAFVLVGQVIVALFSGAFKLTPASDLALRMAAVVSQASANMFSALGAGMLAMVRLASSFLADGHGAWWMER